MRGDWSLKVVHWQRQQTGDYNVISSVFGNVDIDFDWIAVGDLESEVYLL